MGSNGVGGDMAWVGKRPARRLGGMADVLAMAADLGFLVPVFTPLTSWVLGL